MSREQTGGVEQAAGQPGAAHPQSREAAQKHRQKSQAEVQDQRQGAAGPEAVRPGPRGREGEEPGAVPPPRPPQEGAQLDAQQEVPPPPAQGEGQGRAERARFIPSISRNSRPKPGRGVAEGGGGAVGPSGNPGEQERCAGGSGGQNQQDRAEGCTAESGRRVSCPHLLAASGCPHRAVNTS